MARHPTLGAGLAILAMSAAPLAAASQAGYIRVDQAGYETGSPARVFLVTGHTALGARFQVTNGVGQVVLSGSVGAPSGAWGAFEVTPLSLAGLAIGDYAIAVSGVDAQPGRLRIGSPAALYAAPMARALAFYQTERDGPDYVPSALRTAPGHLNDASATVFETPEVTHRDLLADKLLHLLRQRYIHQPDDRLSDFDVKF